ATSRPFEGLLLSLIVLVPVLIDLLGRKGPGLRIAVQTVVLPTSIVFLPVLAWMGYYNWRVTGNVLRMPLFAYAATHDVAPKFLWQSAKPEPAYQHKEVRDLHVGWELAYYEQQKTGTGLVAASVDKLFMLLQRYFPLVIFQIPWLTIPWLAKNERTRRPLLQASCFIVVLLVSEVWLLPHYAAPMTGLLILSVIDGLRLLRLWIWQSRPAGRLLVRTSLVMSAVLLLGYCVQLSRAESEGWNIERARIEARLIDATELDINSVRLGCS